jgi:putative Mg2+ transporter-C (MgtC) family protein
MSNFEWGIVARLVAAVFVGGLIGWNRQMSGKPAGLRTHMLVSVAAAMIVSIPEQVSPTHAVDGLSRAIQGVATGVGFLGAGEILHQENTQRPGKAKVKGLTSAAAIWVTAALGMVCGCGLWVTAIAGTFLVMGILMFGRRMELIPKITPQNEEE